MLICSKSISYKLYLDSIQKKNNKNNCLSHFYVLPELDRKSFLEKKGEGNFWKDNTEHIKKQAKKKKKLKIS